MGIASVVLLSAVFCIWLAGMLRAASAPDPWPVGPGRQSPAPDSHSNLFHRRKSFSSRARPPARAPSNPRGTIDNR